MTDPAPTYRTVNRRLYRVHADGTHVPLTTVHTVNGTVYEEGRPLTREQVDGMTGEGRR